MELKKYFHNKLINVAISMGLGALIVSLFIRLQTDELIVVSTYALLFVIFTAFFQLLKSTVRKFRGQRFKLNKEWLLFSLTVLIGIAFLITGYYTTELFYKIIAYVLCGVTIGVGYSVYRFVYLTAIFKTKEVKQEVLYFSWNMWGEMLDSGAKDEEVADLLVDAQTTTNYRFVNNSWSARFSNVKVYDVVTGEDISTDNNVGIPVAITDQLKKNALACVKTYEKKN